MKNQIKYYCFNKKCRLAIFSEYCFITLIPMDTTMEVQYCTECHKELISKEELNIKIQLSQILGEEKILTSFIIDDDPIYHLVIKKLFEHSTTFDTPDHYMDGPGALHYLSANKHHYGAIPDIIFVDVNMPDMDAWGFLNEFSKLYPKLKKKVHIYVMTSVIQEEYNDYIKIYPYIKGVISKNFDLRFLNNIQV